ncbi:MAG TPA: hypothetical protein VJQ25_01760 [Nitrospira sp.]|nr:hypothetical protein [Nitrospira sp.]
MSTHIMPKPGTMPLTTWHSEESHRFWHQYDIIAEHNGDKMEIVDVLREYAEYIWEYDPMLADTIWNILPSNGATWKGITTDDDQSS